MDEIARKLQSITWEYADKDPTALAALTARIEVSGRGLALITYSDLVQDVVFHFPNIEGTRCRALVLHDRRDESRRRTVRSSAERSPTPCGRRSSREPRNLWGELYRRKRGAFKAVARLVDELAAY